MARLVPYPFRALVGRMLGELERKRAIFDLPERKFFAGSAGHDLSTTYTGRRAGSPLGPVAGPQTQMAQNLVLSWLAGSRILELKTVQVLDELTIPRPCIDMRTIGFNAEWSQELRVEESLGEYVKGSMLITILRDGGYVPCLPGFGDTIFDISLGYDLAGITGRKVRDFLAGMRGAGPLIDRFRAEIPAAHARLRDLPFPTCLATSATLSTLHGCPPDEIERIAAFLMGDLGLNCIIKFNPTLLGPAATRHLLHEVMGYTNLRVPDPVFDRDTQWPEVVDMVERLGGMAARLGLTLGVKFTNTLTVENTTDFLPAGQREVYLSGAPLHVLAMNIVARFRGHFGDRIPVSFSAGIDRLNFPDAVALGLKPVTTGSDLLRTGGYGRLPAYYRELTARMDGAGARALDEWTIRAYGFGEAALEGALLGLPDGGIGAPSRDRLVEALRRGDDLTAAAGRPLFDRWVSAARLLNTNHYVAAATADPRYRRAANLKEPPKIGRHLRLFDCVSCDKCVPACPNDANFTFRTAVQDIPVVKLVAGPAGSRPEWRQEGTVRAVERHQIGTFADFCNDCGNCDVFCPEDGGPYRIKPNFFGSRESWEAARPLGGLFIERRGGADRVLGRFEGVEYRLTFRDGRVEFSGPGFSVEFDESDPRGTVQVSGRGGTPAQVGAGPGAATDEAGEPPIGAATDEAGEPPAGGGEIDLTWCFVMNAIRLGVMDPGEVNYINSLLESVERGS